MKFFVQFCCYISLLIFYATCKMVTIFYTVNRERNEGVQGFSWLFFPTPLHIPYIAYYSLEDGGYPIELTIDSYLFIQCIILMLFPAGMAYKVVMNLRNNTSVVDMLKNGGKIKREKRNWKAVFQLIYGTNPTWTDILLPTEFKA